MTTTTIRLDDELKTRVAAMADREGKTAHAFILDAIEQTVEQAEAEAEFDQLADKRWANVVANGKTIALTDAKQYLVARAAGKRARKPVARKPQR